MEEYSSPNITFFKRKQKNWFQRIYWDHFGFKRRLNKEQISPSIIISFQNTSVRYNKSVVQIIYYHQPLPIVRFRWNPFRKGELMLFLYRTFYPFFVSYYLLKNTIVVVQSNYIKRLFCDRYKHPLEQIYSIKPNMSKIDVSSIVPISFNDEKIHLFYPATPLKYKNHKLLIEMLAFLKKNDPKKAAKIVLHFTCNENTFPYMKMIDELKLNSYFKFEKELSYDKMLSFYKSVDAVLFPSYIETFGLPLIEASEFGLPIFTVDELYAHEVLKNYDGVTFLSYCKPADWAEAISRWLDEKDKKYIHLRQKDEHPGWKDFFILIDSIVNRSKYV